MSEPGSCPESPGCGRAAVKKWTHGPDETREMRFSDFAYAARRPGGGRAVLGGEWRSID